MSDHAGADAPTLDRALHLIRFLRAHCEWDAKQTPDSLLPYLLEESHEVADAVTAGNDDALAGELGDLLLNVAFQVILAEERGAFTAEDVVARLESKMRRRHPHLYGLGEKEPWEELKARERAPDASLLDGIPIALDPLSLAQRIQDRVSAVGFDWREPAGAIEKVREELAEIEALIEVSAGDTAQVADGLEEEIGDLLFSVVNAARLLDSHAMLALRRANDKFARRFRALEHLAAERAMPLGDTDLEQLDALWDEVKRRERTGQEDPGVDGS
jgi:MazG family protein